MYRDNSVFRIKAGADGSEATKNQVTIVLDSSVMDLADRNWLEIMIDNLDWEAEESISITAQNSSATTSLASIGHSLVIEGF